MQQSSKDPAIKLFGQEIPLTDDPRASEQEEDEERTESETDKDAYEIEALQQDAATDEEDENPETQNLEESDSQQQRTLKKPDKILACPRCRSMDTKFCYYNNYNVKQPRHFCKACQRYWTAGGTMRKVPIGAGRRKTKTSSASPYRHLTISEAPTIKGNARMLNFNFNKASNGDSMDPSAPWPYQTFSSNGVYPAAAAAAAYWNCIVPGSWNFPSSHAREEGDMFKTGNNEKTENTCVLVPKTLRIDDPKEAAKSSIWKTLGIKNESNSGGGMFEPKGDDRKKKINHLVETSPALMANPAALSRSLNFHESSCS